MITFSKKDSDWLRQEFWDANNNQWLGLDHRFFKQWAKETYGLTHIEVEQSSSRRISAKVDVRHKMIPFLLLKIKQDQ